MRKAVLIIMAGLVIWGFAACGSAQQPPQSSLTNTGGNSAGAQSNVQKDDDAGVINAAGGMEAMVPMMERIEEMEDYLHSAIDASDESGLAMDMRGPLDMSTLLKGMYRNYEYDGDDWSRVDEDKEYGIKSEASIRNENGVYTYTMTTYDMETPTEIMTQMSIAFDSVNNIVIKQDTVPAMPSAMFDQLYMDESGNLYYLCTQHYRNNELYLNMLYYDGSFIGVATKYIDHVPEMDIKLDFYQQRPASFDDVLVVDDFDLYFTYDGANVVLEGEYY